MDFLRVPCPGCKGKEQTHPISGFKLCKACHRKDTQRLQQLEFIRAQQADEINAQHIADISNITQQAFDGYKAVTESQIETYRSHINSLMEEIERMKVINYELLTKLEKAQPSKEDRKDLEKQLAEKERQLLELESMPAARKPNNLITIEPAGVLKQTQASIARKKSIVEAKKKGSK
jgi:hypothetical protein